MRRISHISDTDVWILEKNRDVDSRENPWEIERDTTKCYQMIVRAETEAEARRVATENASDEVDGFSDVWKNDTFTSCVRLSEYNGDSAVVLKNDHIIQYQEEYPRL